ITGRAAPTSAPRRSHHTCSRLRIPGRPCSPSCEMAQGTPLSPVSEYSHPYSTDRKAPLMADFLDEKRKEIQARLKELKPLVDEYERLEAAERALSGVGGSEAAAAAPTRRRRSSPSASSNGRRGRPRGSGTRSAQALQLVTDNPGITI